MIKLSIVIATFNSELLLKKVLKSIEKQTLSKNEYEILVVDGGSADSTKKIAKLYNCRFMHNPQTEPVHAKFIGFNESKGKYLMYLDHDEALKSKKSLERKLKGFNDNRVKAVIGSGYITPKGYGILNDYINEFGDPFSMFYYRISKEYKRFEKILKNKLKLVKSNKDYYIFKLEVKEKIPLMELLAGGSVFDKTEVNKIFNNKTPKSELTHMLLHLSESNPYISVTKNDPIIHFSADKLLKYLKKIEWRIRNNIFFTDTLGKTGFSGREKIQENNIKKYLFIPYVALLLPVFMDTIYLVITRKKIGYFIHLFLSVYTLFLISYFYTLKLAGYMPTLKSYDGKKNIASK